MDTTARLDALRAAARAGGDRAVDAFRTELSVETKAGPLDPVSETDRAVQRRVIEVLDEHTDDPVVGEEDDARKAVPAAGPAWVVDPIDGTNNFVAGSRSWAVAVAAAVDAEPVAAVSRMPALGDTYAAGDGGTTRNGEPVRVNGLAEPDAATINLVYGYADRDRAAMAGAVDTVTESFGDFRRVGSAAIALAGLASGETEAVVSTTGLFPWDAVGGVHLVRRAGGRVTDPAGDRWTPDSEGLIASNGELHDRLVGAFDAPPD